MTLKEKLLEAIKDQDDEKIYKLLFREEMKDYEERKRNNELDESFYAFRFRPLYAISCRKVWPNEIELDSAAYVLLVHYFDNYKEAKYIYYDQSYREKLYEALSSYYRKLLLEDK